MPHAVGVALLLAACMPPEPLGAPQYGTVVTRLLEDDLVSIDVTMEDADNDAQVIAFGDCAAAQYALIRGSGFVRRVTNDVSRRGRIWTGEGIYTLSDSHPGGTITIDAEVTADACREQGIPSV